MATKSKSRTMTDDHKSALAMGRTEGRAVRAYLEALDTSRPKRGRKRTTASISARLERITDEIQPKIAHAPRSATRVCCRWRC